MYKNTHCIAERTFVRVLFDLLNSVNTDKSNINKGKSKY